MDYRDKMLTQGNYKDAFGYTDNPLMALAIILANGYCNTSTTYFKTALEGWKATRYGSAIGIPAGAYICESDLRSKLFASSYFTNAKEIPDKETYIQKTFIKPAKAANRWRP